MIPVLYNALETEFANNGLGGLPDATSCIVTEQRNTPGGYFLEMEYPVDGLHYSDIATERIIYASPAPDKTPQPFRISRISRPINGIVYIEAPHVSAEMQKIVTYGVQTSQNPQGACYNYMWRARNIGQENPFWLTTDITLDAPILFNQPNPVSLMDVLLGAEGSVLDLIGGEYEFDNWHVILHERRGVDSNIEIRYGVNMTDMTAETDLSELVTAVVPFWSGDVNGTATVVIGDLCVSGNAAAFAINRALPLDVTNQFDSSTAPTKAQVTAAGQSFINNSDQTQLSSTINVKYTPITLSIGKRNVYLCDTVKVVHPDLGVSSTAKIVEVKYNVLTEKYEEITIGSIKKTIVDTIANIINKR